MNKKSQELSASNSISRDALKIILHHRTFKKLHKFLEESQWRTKDQLEEYQLNELNKLIQHAYQTVPYYTKLFNQLGLKPKDIQDLKDLQKLPFLTKKIIKKNWNDFISKGYKKRKIEYITTGGSTGEPLGLFVLRGIAQAKHAAFIQTLLDRKNLSFRNKHIYLIGRDTVLKYQAFRRVLILSSFFIEKKMLDFYIKKIRGFNPKFIIAYPSAISILANHMEKNKIDPFPSIKNIICSGETLFEWQRNLIEDIFECRVNECYSLSEQTLFSGTCNNSYLFHFPPEYGVLELVDDNGNSVTSEGKRGEIVGTGFINYVFPLIRYKSEDIGINTNQKCNCGRNYPLLKKIEGRTQEFIVTNSHKIMPITGIYGLVAKSTNNVLLCQFIQEEEGEIILNIVKTENYTKKDGNLILNNFQKNLGNYINLSIHYVNNIPRTKGGKHRFLIQKLPIDVYNY
jgi:phenylacetate-CoA ligase